MPLDDGLLDDELLEDDGLLVVSAAAGLAGSAVDLAGSADILALSGAEDDEDVDDDDEGEFVLPLADGEAEAPIDCVLELELLSFAVLSLLVLLLSFVDLPSLALPEDCADFWSESSLALDAVSLVLSLTFSATSFDFSPIFLAVSFTRSVIELPEVWLSVAAGVEPGFSCCASAPVPATASVQARAMKVRFMGVTPGVCAKGTI